MKCEMIQDILPLYIEGLCSEETKDEVENHIKNCKYCSGMADNLGTPLENVLEEIEDKDILIEPMKKVKRKMRRKNKQILISLFFSFILISALSVLAYNQVNRTGISFEVIYEYLRFQHVGQKFASGDIEALLSTLAIPGNDDNFGAYAREAYDKDENRYIEDTKEYIFQQYENLFAEKDLVFKEVLVDYYAIDYHYYSDAKYLRVILVYEVDRIEYVIRLKRTGSEKFSVIDGFVAMSEIAYESNGELEEDFNDMEYNSVSELLNYEKSIFNCLQPFDDCNLYLVKSTIRKLYEQQVAGERDNQLIGIESDIFLKEEHLNKSYEVKSDYHMRVNNHLQEIINQGYLIKDINFVMEGYSKEKHMYSYRVTYIFENIATKEESDLSINCYRNDTITDCFMLVDLETITLKTSEQYLNKEIREKMLTLWE